VSAYAKSCLRFRPGALAPWVIVVAVSALPVAAAARKQAEPQGAPRAVILDVVALDNRGEPVADLIASDLRVSDNGQRQEVVFFRPNRPKRIAGALAPREFSNRAHPAPTATVILFDLMNERTMADPITQNELVAALKGQESGAGLYLYILTNRGNVIPIHVLPYPETDTAADEHWTERIHPLLDPVINQIFSLRPIEDWDPGYRFQATLQAVSELGAPESREASSWRIRRSRSGLSCSTKTRTGTARCAFRSPPSTEARKSRDRVS